MFVGEFISVKEYGSIFEFDKKPMLEEICEIKKFSVKNAFETEKTGFFFIPSRITYIRKTSSNIEELLVELNKSKRKKIKKTINKIKNNSNLELIKDSPLSKELFEEWYTNVYIPKIKSKTYGVVHGKINWWELDLNNHNKYGIFFKKDGKIIAGMVAKSYPENEEFPRRMSISWSAINEEAKSMGLNDYLNIEMIRFAKNCDYEYISRGKDTNLYGKRLSSGIPVFKMSLGYRIVPFKKNMSSIKKNNDVLLKFNNLDDFDDIIFFVSYAKNSKKLIANLILKKYDDDIKDIIKKYNRPFFLKIRIFKYENRQLNLANEISND